MILLPLLAITALVLGVEFASARQVLCSLEHTALDLEVGDSISIHSPNYPLNYPANEECGWNVKLIGTEDMRISCSNFKMEKPNTNGTCEDFLQIENEWYCGNNGSLDVTISSENITKLKFVSDKDDESESGFNCTVTALFYEGREYLTSFVVTNINYTDELADPKSPEFDLAKNEIYNSVGVGLKKTMGEKLFKFEVIRFEEDSLWLNTTHRPHTKIDPSRKRLVRTWTLETSGRDPKRAIRAQPEVIIESVISNEKEDCTWDWTTDFPKIKPIIMNDMNEIVHQFKIGTQYEKSNLEVSVEHGKSLLFTCTGVFGNANTKNYLLTYGPGTSYIKAECRNKELIVRGNPQEMKKMGCRYNSKSVIHIPHHIDHDHACGPDGKMDEEKVGNLYYISYKITDTEFTDLITVCYNSDKEATLWTKHTIDGTRFSTRDMSEISSWNFEEKKELKKSYEIKDQRDLFLEEKIDLQKNGVCICQNFEYYFAKGHMSPDGDFITLNERRSTYHYMNAVPQWQPFNNGNWKYIEKGMRTLASDGGKELTIISGGYGILEMERQMVPIYLKTNDDLDDDAPEVLYTIGPGNKDPVSIYKKGFEELPAPAVLYMDNGKVPIYLKREDESMSAPAKLPVPAFTWKLVYEERKNLDDEGSSIFAVAFITTNHPNTQLEIADSMPINPSMVRDVCDEYSWIDNLNSTDPEKGYTYCLRYGDLISIVDYIPREFDGINVLGVRLLNKDPPLSTTTVDHIY